MNESSHPAAWYLAHFDREVARFADVIDGADLSTAVPSCPGWSIGRLVEHLGVIHRWAGFCAANSRPPSAEEAEAAASLDPYDDSHAVGWFRHGAAELRETLTGLDPTAPTWHPFPVDKVNALWPRRQAHEATVHRWDAEAALGVVTPVDPVLASDAIDEYFEVIVPRLVAKGRTLPAGSFHVHCTDVDGEWLVWAEDGEYRMVREHRKGDAALRGPAASVLLRLWGRIGDEPDLSPVGDSTVLGDWLALGGN